MVESSAKKPTGNMSDLFRYSELRRKTFILFFTWFSISSCYYGLSFNSEYLGEHSRLCSVDVGSPVCVLQVATSS